MSTNWREILDDYIARINEKAHDRVMEEWLPSGEINYPGSPHEQEAEREVGQLADIHTNFIKFADSRPNACEHMMEKLLNVRQSLMENIDGDLMDVRIAIGPWIQCHVA